LLPRDRLGLFPSREFRRELHRILDQQPRLADLTFPQPGETGLVAEGDRLGPDPAWAYPAVRVPLAGAPGRLLAGRMPGWPRPERLEGELDAIAASGVRRMICFVPREDLRTLYRLPRYAEEARKRLGDGHGFVEVVDYEPPGDVETFMDAIAEVDARVGRGETVLVHCGAGCGRTGMFAACLLVLHGASPVDAIRSYRRLRGCGPETPEQVAFVAWYARFRESAGE
jgi:protein-tyrosine phosphatase